MRETIFYTSPFKPRGGSSQLVRLDGDLYNQISEIARRCHISITEVASRIVRDGMPFVRVIDGPLYELNTGGDEDIPTL